MKSFIKAIREAKVYAKSFGVKIFVFYCKEKNIYLWGQVNLSSISPENFTLVQSF